MLSAAPPAAAVPVVHVPDLRSVRRRCLPLSQRFLIGHFSRSTRDEQGWRTETTVIRNQ